MAGTSLLCRCGLPNASCGVCGLGYNQRVGIAAPTPAPAPAPLALPPSSNMGFVPSAPAPAPAAPANPAPTTPKAMPAPPAATPSADGPAPPESSDEEGDDGKVGLGTLMFNLQVLYFILE